MNKANFLHTGGFPFETNSLGFMQEAYSLFNGFGEIAGNYSIIKGCNTTGTNVTDGLVYVNGELYPFKGGIQQPTIILVKDSQSLPYEDGVVREIYSKPYFTFGSGIETLEWSMFKRFSPLTTLTEKIKSLETKLSKVVPVGLVAVWDRPADQIPEGWVEHTDMSGLVPVGQKTTDEDFKTLGKNIGSKTHRLTVEELAEHSHDIVAASSSWAVEPRSGNQHLRALPPGGKKTSKTGGNKPHNNIQPSRIVRYIRFEGLN